MGQPVNLLPQGPPIYMSLVVLLFQTFVPVVVRYSHKSSSLTLTASSEEDADTSKYYPAVVTLFAEFVKCIIAILFIFKAMTQRPGTSLAMAAIQTPKHFARAIHRLRALFLPAMLYFVANVTAIHALSHVRSYIFAAIMNSRIVFAALLSVALLNKSLSAEQWRALVMIFCAATVLCLEDVKINDDYTISKETGGIIVALCTALVSAAGGVFMEKYLNLGNEGHSNVAHNTSPRSKDLPKGLFSSSSPSMWEQQGVLAVFSSIFACLYVVIFHMDAIKERQLMQGWNGTVKLLTFLQAVQGVFVAMLIQKCGIVVRMIVGTISICFCIIFEGLVFHEPILLREVLMIVLVLMGSNIYFSAKPGSNGHSDGGERSASGSGLIEGRTSSSSTGTTGASSSSSSPISSYPFKKISTFLSPNSSKNAGVWSSNHALRKVIALFLVAVLYISISSSYSVMLASQPHGEENIHKETLLQVNALDLDKAASGHDSISSGTSARHTTKAAAVGQNRGERKRKQQQRNEEEEEEKEEEEKERKPLEKDEAVSMTEDLKNSYFVEFMDMLKTGSPVLKAAATQIELEKNKDLCDIEAVKKQVSWDKNDGQKRDIGVCLQIRNDAAILDEYIAFHWLQGASHFIIYDDNSDDDPWSVLEKYAGLGIVEFHDMLGHPLTSGNELQTNNLNECFTALRARYDELGLRWLMFPDVDEFFLSSNSNETLTELLNAKYKEEACMEISRTWYGSSFNHKAPEGLITENFVLASPDHADGYPKMMANIYPEGDFKQNATQLYTVHNVMDQNDIPCKWKGEIHDIRINHYVRSLQHYERKMLTGHKALNRYTEPLKLFWERDRNEVFSPIALEYSCRIKALLSLLDDMKVQGKIPAAPRPTPWNETHTWR